MNRKLKISYGEANFANLRNDGALYIDKTHFIPLLENEKKAFFIRPRRIGKSLWISLLQYYYDINEKDRFDVLFQDLYIHKNPTPLKNSYLILKMDFSSLNTTNEDELKKSFTFNIRLNVEYFFESYPNIFGNELSVIKSKIETIHEPEDLIRMLHKEVQRKNQKIYVLIDEYDHFANKIVSEGRESFLNTIIQRSGFVRQFYEALKIGSGEGVFERFFITGVSPLMLDELSSGFNITSNLSNHPDFNEMLGLTYTEVKSILDMVDNEQFQEKSKEQVMKDLVFLYNGYKFHHKALNTIFNSDMILYFFNYFKSGYGYPEPLLDDNVKTDYSKLRGLIIGTSGKELLQTILEELTLQKEISVEFVRRFTFEKRFDEHQMKSLLYYLGLLTFKSEGVLQIPNWVIQELFWEYFRIYLTEEKEIHFDFTPLAKAVDGLANRGELNGLENLVKDFFKRKLANYDYTRLSEKHIKFLLIAYFSMVGKYNVISERELPEGKRVDLLLEAHPASQTVKYDCIIEFKYVARKDSKRYTAIKEEAVKQVREYLQLYKEKFLLFGRELKGCVILVKHTKQAELVEV